MNQRRISILVCGFGLLVGALLFVFFMTEKSKNEKGAADPSPDSSTQQSSGRKNTPQVAKPIGMTDHVWTKANDTHSTLAGLNRSVSFYGKCVDQDGKPISGVMIEAELLSTETSLMKYLSGPEQKREVVKIESDAVGEFKIERKTGYSIRFEKMAKLGYKPSGSTPWSYSYSSLVDRSGASDFRPDRSNPVVFKIWKTGNPEALYVTDVNAEFFLQKNINKVPAILLPKSINGIEQAVTVEYSVSGSNEYGFAKIWEFRISGGDFCLADDFGNLAPIDGYYDSIEVRSQDKSFNQHPKNRRFFWRTKDQKVHGIFSLDPSAARHGNGRLHFEDVRINPSGSRNLEYDPNMRIKVKR